MKQNADFQIEFTGSFWAIYGLTEAGRERIGGESLYVDHHYIEDWREILREEGYAVS